MTSFRSKFEKTVSESLPADARYEAIKLEYVTTHTYTPDWVLRNGVIIEAKGVLDAPTRSKMIAVKMAHPDLDIRFVFMRDNTISKTSKTTYSAWATKNGFPWCIGTVPSDWLT